MANAVVELWNLVDRMDDCSDGSLTCDCRITPEELIRLFGPYPDLDLLDETGAFNPGQDGVLDSTSIGIGFTAVPAAFPAPVR